MTNLFELYASKARQEFKIFKMKKDFPDMPEGVKALQDVLAETDAAIETGMQDSNVAKPGFPALKKIYQDEAARQRKIAYEEMDVKCDNCQLGVTFYKYGETGLPKGTKLCGKLQLVHGKVLEKKRTKLKVVDGKIIDDSGPLSEEEAAKLHEILHNHNAYCGDSYEPIGPEDFAMKDAETRIAEINEWEREELKQLGF
jgi:hypothetical protein